MTANEVAYWQLQEQKRANLVDQAERNRHNKAVEDETARNNLFTNKVSEFSAKHTAARQAAQSEVDRMNAVTSGVRNIAGGAKDLSTTLLSLGLVG